MKIIIQIYMGGCFTGTGFRDRFPDGKRSVSTAAASGQSYRPKSWREKRECSCPFISKTGFSA